MLIRAANILAVALLSCAPHAAAQAQPAPQSGPTEKTVLTREIKSNGSATGVSRSYQLSVATRRVVLSGAKPELTFVITVSDPERKLFWSTMQAIPPSGERTKAAE